MRRSPEVIPKGRDMARIKLLRDHSLIRRKLPLLIGFLMLLFVLSAGVSPLQQPVLAQEAVEPGYAEEGLPNGEEEVLTQGLTNQAPTGETPAEEVPAVEAPAEDEGELIELEEVQIEGEIAQPNVTITVARQEPQFREISLERTPAEGLTDLDLTAAEMEALEAMKIEDWIKILKRPRQ